MRLLPCRDHCWLSIKEMTRTGSPFASCRPATGSGRRAWHFRQRVLFAGGALHAPPPRPPTVCFLGLALPGISSPLQNAEVPTSPGVSLPIPLRRAELTGDRVVSARCFAMPRANRFPPQPYRSSPPRDRARPSTSAWSADGRMLHALAARLAAVTRWSLANADLPPVAAVPSCRPCLRAATFRRGSCRSDYWRTLRQMLNRPRVRPADS